jgi:hypothetical protein
MTGNADLRARLQDERLARLERAVCELALDLHGVSTTAHIRSNGKPALASLLAEFRGEVQETAVHHPQETR